MEKPDRIRILLVDDPPIVREGLAAIINRQADMQVVAEASNGKQALEVFRQHPHDLTPNLMPDVTAPKQLPPPFNAASSI